MLKHGRKIAFTLCILVMAAGIGYLVYQQVQKKENNDVYEKMKEEVVIPQEQEPAVDEPVEIPIDFAALKETNEDIYAWIEVPNTNIRYPIVQSPTDDTYYLEHTIEGVKGYPGSIYTEKANAKDFSDFVTVIYGHNMKDGSMFRHLHNYEEKEFLDENSTVTIYTEDSILTYEIFISVLYDDRHILHNYNFAQEEERESFIESLYQKSTMKKQINEDVKVDADSKIIILSTCDARDDQRYLVGAVMIDEQK